MQPSARQRRRHVGDVAFGPLITSSTYANAYESAFDQAKRAHGLVTAREGWSGEPTQAPPGALIMGTKAPRLTNAEAVRLLRAFRYAAIALSVRWTIWSQYAALAYGWNPPAADSLDASAAQAAASYVPDLCVALWMELHRLSEALDAANHADQPARLDLDTEFQEVGWLAELRSALAQDGAIAQWKIPAPFCRDKRTGRSRTPYPPCDTADPITGKPWRKCDAPGDCEPVLVDDPLTTLVNKLLPLALIVGAVWLFVQPEETRRPRRYRTN